MDFTTEWVNQLLNVAAEDSMWKQHAFEACASLHYRVNNMDMILERYIGKLDEFIEFLEQEWGWSVTVSEDKKTIWADEKKDTCVCPVVSCMTNEISHNICYCSEKFTEKMFARVCEKEVKATVKRSVIRDGKSCIYEISLLN